MKTRTIFLWILLLIIIDQAIKLIINHYFFERHFDIIPPLVEFMPVFNDKHSYVNVLLNDKFNVNFGLFIHLIIFSLAAIITTAVYDFYKSITKDKLLDLAFIFYMAGWSCGLMGNLIWTKGVLDYIYLKPLFIFDLKDIYINCFTFLLFLSLIKNRPKTKKIKMKDFMLHIKKRLRVIIPSTQ